MQLFILISGGVFGLLVGSFLNALVYRLKIGESIVLKRSHCPSCSHTLAWYDLVPILSYFILLRRCRHCKKKISFQYPLVELATGILFIFITAHVLHVFPIESQVLFFIFYFLFLGSIFAGLFTIFIYDLKHYLIPDVVLFPLVGFTFLYRLIEIPDFEVFFLALLSGFLASSFFLALFLVSRGRWMGFGDVKLVFFMGLFLGYPNILVALFVAFMSGAIIGMALLTLKRKKLKSQVPFAPFLIAGTFVAFFWGQAILDWYFSLIFL